jgi:hypothetical protein
LAINIVKDHPDVDVDPTDDLSTEFERLRQSINPSDLAALDKILQFNPKAPSANI